MNKHSLSSVGPLVLLFLSGFFVVACSSTQVTPAPGRSSAERMERSGRVYIATPADGAYAGKTYNRSGAAVASALESAFARFADGTTVGPISPSTASIIEAAKAQGCMYAVVPKITRWEDRATEWSGISDKMAIFVRVLRADNGREIVASEITGKSSWLTMGGDHPEDLLRKPAEAFVVQLY